MSRRITQQDLPVNGSDVLLMGMSGCAINGRCKETFVVGAYGGQLAAL
jgi:hypothetical protein